MTLYVEDYNFVMEQLQARYGFTAEHAADAIDRLSESPNVFNALVAFLRTGNHPSLSIQGHDVKELTERYALSPIGAYLMLSELAVNPSRAQGYLEDIWEDGHEIVEYNPDGSIKKITHRTIGSGSEAPSCPKCGKPATWIEQYQRWYCYDCKEYL